MTDIFNEWKRNRFICSSGSTQGLNCAYIVILTDIGFWVDHFDELKEWCETTGCRQQGMTVEIPTEEFKTAFYLRWL